MTVDTTGTRESFASRTQRWGVSPGCRGQGDPGDAVCIVRVQAVGTPQRVAAASMTRPGWVAEPTMSAVRLDAPERADADGCTCEARAVVAAANGPRRQGPPPLPRRPRPSEAQDEPGVIVLDAGAALPRPGRTCIVVPSPEQRERTPPGGWRALKLSARWLRCAGLSPVQALTAVTGLWLLIVLTVGALGD